MVLFVTGLCPNSCFYCPLSDERRGKDLVFANERSIKNDEDLLKEAELMNALGTGITGGEPLMKIERVLHYITITQGFFWKRTPHSSIHFPGSWQADPRKARRYRP